MNTRRRMRAKFIRWISRRYIANHPMLHLATSNELRLEFLYTKNANREMRESKHFGLPNRKEFEKLISNPNRHEFEKFFRRGYNNEY